MKIVGREIEQHILAERLVSDEAELITIYGRRRVGKTYLIRAYYEKVLAFEFTGVHQATMKTQLENFSQALRLSTKSTLSLETPRTWFQAFVMLNDYVKTLSKKKPAVIFFDEFPWIETHKSGFLQAFDHWWNTSASRQPHIKVVICGSAASWMIEKIINNRGGLHNRVTQTIRLLPFTLRETELYLQSRNIVLDRYNQLQLYMAIGGIPHYLKNIQPGNSTAQAIDKLAFTKDGLLKSEFNNLYQSLFANFESHEMVVRALANKTSGLTRNEIIQACGFTTGGTTTKILNELEESGFITPQQVFEKNANEGVYRLSDEFTLFYIKFIEHPKDKDKGAWQRLATTSSYTSWSGFAFESVCLKHTLQIRKALGIEGIVAIPATWRHSAGKGLQGAQIDLLLDRSDRAINLCEMKFSTEEFSIDKKYAGELDAKFRVFKETTKTKKVLFPTMITTYGVKKNVYYLGRIQSQIVMGDLFK